MVGWYKMFKTSARGADEYFWVSSLTFGTSFWGIRVKEYITALLCWRAISMQVGGENHSLFFFLENWNIFAERKSRGQVYKPH